MLPGMGYRRGSRRFPISTNFWDATFLRRRMFEEALWVLCELGPEKMQTVVRNPRETKRQMLRQQVRRIRPAIAERRSAAG